ncbi:F-box/WD repeat-containing protein 4 isoform X4 [Chiloscyllium plagiosum]|uniref:F-box/WD repeat-containing protein 4 isoform X4 n=1 Tax=Chiloscyllium plagiosum TaxID=36176 RepID=UPI001CB87E87|nr:F-box/WD repeat-containing protein 4 isoform X4 [Chiloscyllium plagiosum]
MLVLLLHQLPEDILLLLFSYSDTQTLGRLAQVCKKFHSLISRDTLWRRIAKVSLNTGITRLGRDTLLPWLQLDDQWLYLSQAADIRAYSLRQNSVSFQRRPVSVYTGHQDDVCRFVVSESHVISGGGDGRIIICNTCNSFCTAFSAHNQEVNCIDSRGHVIVSGSRDKTARIWSLCSNRLGECLHKIRTEDRVWSVAINPTLSSVMTGTACCGHASPLRIWDLQSGQLESCLGSDFRRGAGVLDILYETPSVVLTCGYDTYIRQWDMRASIRRSVMEWEEPHDSALYCLQTDGNFMIASGSSRYGVVRLWDKRQTKSLQVFFLSSPSSSSPVYCLRFTTSHLYSVLAHALYMLDFTICDQQHGK